jgi:predicted anti-sigma-YlaC factor YlaD
MNCKQFKRHLTAYLDGQTDAGLTENLERHLQICASCRLERERLHSVNQWLGDDLVPPLTDPYLLARIRRRLQSPSVGSRLPALKYRTWATATVLIGLLLGVTFGTKIGEVILPGSDPIAEIVADADYWSDDQSLTAFYTDNVDEWSNGVGGNNE